MPTAPTTAATRARERLPHARLMGIFTPRAIGEDDALERALAAAPWLDLIQVRVKAPGRRSGPAPAAATFEWSVRLLDAFAALDDPPPLIVNDRPDVARALGERCAGVHLGQDDMAPDAARAFLGADAVIGLSTHDTGQVVRADDAPVDYLGFGPIFPTDTKGYERGLGPEAAWAAAAGAAPRAVFPIGGIDVVRAFELERVGRAAIGAAIFCADDPGAAARELRDLLGDA